MAKEGASLTYFAPPAPLWDHERRPHHRLHGNTLPAYYVPKDAVHFASDRMFEYLRAGSKSNYWRTPFSSLQLPFAKLEGHKGREPIGHGMQQGQVAGATGESKQLRLGRHKSNKPSPSGERPTYRDLF